jgi:M6 family metalloprotease-like protein
MNFLKTVFLVLFFTLQSVASVADNFPIIQRLPKPDVKLTQGDVRVLVVLVEFADVRFKSADPVSQFTDYLNKEGYNEYYNIGSVRDYFIKNSMGKFRPVFDVYGPVTLPGMQSDYGGYGRNADRDKARLALSQTLDSLHKWGEIDFGWYDENDDGVVDYVMMIYAGISAYPLTGIPAIYPHAGYFGEKGDKLSGKKVGDVGPYINRYACSSEIDPEMYMHEKSTSNLNGIGTFVHEFSHLLGLPDFYSNNGNATLGSWSVMDEGNHNCPQNAGYIRKCSPPLYSAFERMSLGWLKPTELKTSGKIQLNKLDDNVAYSITNPENPDEVYLLEYRTNKGWDVGQENSGMLIWHIDYVDSIWTTMVNSKEWHMHVDIIEAKGSGFDSSPSDVFPGSANVTEFNKFVFWNGLDMNITLSDITESPDKEYVTFNVTMGIPFLSVSSSSSSVMVVRLISDTRPFSASSIAVSKTSPQQASVISQDGIINITTSLPRTKMVRMFSLNGQLLFETTMNDTELQVRWPKHLGKQKAVLSVTQGNVNLFMGVIQER